MHVMISIYNSIFLSYSILGVVIFSIGSCLFFIGNDHFTLVSGLGVMFKTSSYCKILPLIGNVCILLDVYIGVRLPRSAQNLVILDGRDFHIHSSLF